MSAGERRLTVRAYAVVVRDEEILLTRLASRVTSAERWTLPGGGVEHGESPRDAVVREVHEETGLDVEVADAVHVISRHSPHARGWDGEPLDVHGVWLLHEGWVAKDAPDPRVVEVGGSSADAAWQPLAGVEDGTVPVTAQVTAALARLAPARLQRLGAYALVRRASPEPAVLLTRISERGFHAGSWTLPGGGVEHGESPREAVRREVHEETGLEVEVGALLDVDDVHLHGTAPSGRDEDFHGVHLAFSATLLGSGSGSGSGSGGGTGVEPRVVEVDGTTAAVAWVSERDLADGTVPALAVVRVALRAARAVGAGSVGWSP